MSGARVGAAWRRVLLAWTATHLVVRIVSLLALAAFAWAFPEDPVWDDLHAFDVVSLAIAVPTTAIGAVGLLRGRPRALRWLSWPVALDALTVVGSYAGFAEDTPGHRGMAGVSAAIGGGLLLACLRASTRAAAE